MKMNCPNCKGERIRIEGVSPNEKEVYIFCNDCKLYSTLFRKGVSYTSVNEMDELDVKIEKEELKKDPDYQNC